VNPFSYSEVFSSKFEYEEPYEAPYFSCDPEDPEAHDDEEL
jgi:hypothetical protein